MGKSHLTSNIDFSGVEKFLELSALLEKDWEPTLGQWDELFLTPGYAVLIKIEFPKEFFIERFKLAFMPSKKAALEAKLREEKGFYAQFLPHYVRVRDMRYEIAKHIENLKKMSFVAEAVQKAKEYLPEFEVEEYPPLSFIIFGPDSRGYAPVVVDVLHSIDNKDTMITLFAHEFHHYYRNKFFEFPQKQDIIWVIDQIQKEGIADQINVGKWFHDKELYSTYAITNKNKNYLEWYAKTPEIIQTMDKLFSFIADHPEEKGELGANLKELIPLSGHPTGFYMSNLIIEQLGKDALTKKIGNPFAFFTLYKQAADKKGGNTPTFSEKTIKFIRALESKYIRYARHIYCKKLLV